MHLSIWKSACNFDWDIRFSASNSVGWHLKHLIWLKFNFFCFFFVNLVTLKPQLFLLAQGMRTTTSGKFQAGWVR